MATDASTSVALAPTNVVVTCTIGGTISGYCEMGKPDIATRPSSTMMMEITMATMGRLTKNSATGLVLDLIGGGGAAGVDAEAATGTAFTVIPSRRRCSPSTTTRSPGLQALVDHPQVAHARAHLDAANADLVLRIDHRDIVTVLQFLHGALQHQ